MRNKESGQSLVESALVFPIVFFLFIGFLDLGRVLYFYASMTTAVREATRFAIVDPDSLSAAYLGNPETIEQKVRDYVFGMNPDSPNLHISVTVLRDEETDSNTDVTVTADYCFKAITPLVDRVIGEGCPSSQKGILLTVDSTMHVSPYAR